MSRTRDHIYPRTGPGTGRIGMLAGTLVAALLLSCATASVALATEQVGFYVAGEKSEEEAKRPRFEAEKYSAELRGPGTSPHTYSFTVEGAPASIECPTSEYFGTLSSAGPKLSLSPTYAFLSCNSSIGSISIAANGCQHTLTLANSGPPYVGTFGVTCPTKAPYEFRAQFCTLSIPPQTALAEASFKNTGAGSSRAVETTLKVSKLEYTLSGSLFCKETNNNGTLTGTSLLKAFH
jgi:hypothetical protein